MLQTMPYQLIGKDQILPYFKEAMDIYAKYHVERALMAASENADMDIEYYSSLQEGSCGFIDKDSILESYPEENII